MDKSTNLFALWARGQLLSPKIYLIRVHYKDLNGNHNTFLKLGRTRRLLQERIKEFLSELRRRTRWQIEKCQVLSILNTSNDFKMEAYIHYGHDSLAFYNEHCHRIRFKGFTEIYQDTEENLNLIQNPSCCFHGDEYLIN